MIVILFMCSRQIPSLQYDWNGYFRDVEESGQPRRFWEPEHAVIAGARSNRVIPTYKRRDTWF